MAKCEWCGTRSYLPLFGWVFAGGNAFCSTVCKAKYDLNNE